MGIETIGTFNAALKSKVDVHTVFRKRHTSVILDRKVRCNSTINRVADSVLQGEGTVDAVEAISVGRGQFTFVRETYFIF